MRSYRDALRAALARAHRSRELRHAALAAVVGAIAFFLLGTTPTRLPPPVADAAPWTLPTLPAGPVEAAWPGPVWVSEPAVAAAATATLRPPRLLGIVRVAGQSAALFEMPDGQRLRAAEGERLPDGAVVTAVAPTRAAWRDAEGRTHEARLLDARTL
jgi:hypothetical protein